MTFEVVINQLEGELQNYVASLSKRPNVIRPQSVAFRIVDGRTTNAQAQLSTSGSRSILLHSGAVRNVTAMWRLLLARRDFLPWVGDAGCLRESDAQRGPMRKILLELSQEDAWRLSVPPPRCDIRADAADLLTQLVLQFLVCHEYAHHSHGHLSLLVRSRGLDSLEAFPKPVPPIDAVLLHTLELDADSFAATAAVKLLLEATKRQAGTNNHLRIFVRSAEDAIYVSALVHCGVYWLLGLFDRTIEDCDSSSHPHALVRLFAARGTTKRLLEIKHPNLAAECFTEQWNRAAIDMREWLAVEQGSSPVIEHIRESGAPALALRTERFLESWARIRTSLQEFAWVTDLAPAQAGWHRLRPTDSTVPSA